MVFYYLYFFQLYQNLGGKGPANDLEGLLDSITQTGETTTDNFGSLRQK